MDLLTHIVLTRKLIGRAPFVLATSVVPDAPFYLAYPAWLLVKGKLGQAVVANVWPHLLRWMAMRHHAFHSLRMALVAGAMVCPTRPPAPAPGDGGGH
jgi:hypothetical protein